MSSYLDCYIEKYNPETNQWENLSLYKKENDEYKAVNAYGYSASCCGDVLCGSSYDNYSLAIVKPRGIPEDASPEVKEFYGDGKYFYDATWYDYCELTAYQHAINKLVKPILDIAKPKDDDVYDEDSEDYWNDVVYEEYQEQIECFEGFMDCINKVLEAYGIWYPKYGQIRIVIWISQNLDNRRYCGA